MTAEARSAAGEKSCPVALAVTIRPAGPADLDAIEILENHAFIHDRLSRRNLRRLLSSPTACTQVAVAEGSVRGYAVVLFRHHATAARLYSIAVDPRMARRGIGQALLAAAEASAAASACTRLCLEVRSDNQPAIALYRANGYCEYGRRAQYYADGATALCFEKRL